MEAQYPQPAPPAPESKKRNTWLYIGGGLGLLAVACLGCLVAAIAFVVIRDDGDQPVPTVIISGVTPASTVTSHATSIAPTSTEEGQLATAAITPIASPEATSSPAPTETPISGATATPLPPGAGRSNPIPFGEAGVSADSDWEIQVLEVTRGEEAWNQVSAANQFNEPPSPGMEYVMVNFRASYIGGSSDLQIISTAEFESTGEAGVRWRNPFVVTPSPELFGELFTGGEATGWVVLQAQANEGSLLAVFRPPLSFDDEDVLYLALEDGAAVPQVTGRVAEVNDLGVDRLNPAPFGEHVVTDTWEIWVAEVIRGEEALNQVMDAFEFNAEPAEGQEYILVLVHARNVTGGESTENIVSFSFESTGSSGVLHEHVFIVEPQPPLDFDIYPGGEAAGWVVVVADVGETEMSLVFNDALFSGETRYLALSE